MKIYYLGVRFTAESNTNLSEYRSFNNLSNYPGPKLGFHTTIAYSRTPFKYHLEHFPELNLTVKEPILLGTSLALKFIEDLQVVWLKMRHAECLEGGATYDHPFYIPHITIAENMGVKEVADLPKNLSKEKIPVVISEIFYNEWE